MLKNLRPILWTNAIEDTLHFYTQLLDFTIEEYNTQWGWASISKDDVAIMFAKPNEHKPFTQPQFTGSFYIQTTDVEMLWQKLQSKVAICYDIATFDWGMREFAIYDNNGYIIQFGQEI